MEIVYRSIDGMIFSSKEECERYEAPFLENLKNAEIEFYECDGTPMPIVPESLSDCSFIYAKNEKALNVLEWMGNYMDTVVPDKCGFWRWSTCSWESLEDDLKPWMNIYNIVYKVMTDFKKS